MNNTLADFLNKTEETDAGRVFSGTREDYDAVGVSLLNQLYELEAYVIEARQTLIKMAGKY